MARIIVLVLMMLPALSVASRILLIPCTHKSHVLFMAKTGRSLQDVGGHKVDVLVLESRRSMVEKVGVTAISYAMPPEASELESDNFIKVLVQRHGKDISRIFGVMTNLGARVVESIVQNEQMMMTLESHRYDIVLIDGVDFARALYIIPYALGLRYITIATRIDPWPAGVPSLPSVEHIAGISTPITEHSTIMDRISNLIKFTMVYLNMPPDVLDESLIVKYAPTRPKVTFAELFSNSEMWLVNLDTVCLDWPITHGNHYQLVPGLALEQPKPLSDELEEFVKGSRVGVIVLTFGSGLKDIPEDMLEKMLHAFSQVEYRVIMRHSGPVPVKVPGNVKIMSWLPQSDLLAHQKVKAFITHGGRNGQQEAMYHAVPMITIPMFGDQFYNALRVNMKGLGVSLDKDSFTSTDLVHAIKNVTQERTIRDNIRKCSERFRSFPNAQDKVLFWTEHVIRYGSDHLKPVSLRVPIWKHFMLDILGLLILIILVVYTIMLCLFSYIFKKICSTSKAASVSKKTA